MYADISYYLEAIGNLAGRFRTLKSIDILLDNRGMPDFQSGSRSVIFKVGVWGGKYAMKCYTHSGAARKRHAEAVADYLNRMSFPELSPYRYLDREIYIYDHSGQGAFQPVALTPWVEGITLRRWLADRCGARDRPAIRKMAATFVDLALRLLEQPWAHGNLKPENIIVSKTHRLRLIDYDNMYLPSFSGLESPELGTPGFQHPYRTARFFNSHLDDYSLALIATALYALSDFPQWYPKRQEEELLLFDPHEVLAGKSAELHAVKTHWLESNRTDLYRLAIQLQQPAPHLPELPRILKQIRPEEQPVRYPVAGEVSEIYRENGFYGFRSGKREKLTEAVFDDAGGFHDGLARVRIGKKNYYIGTDGKKRIDATAFEQTEDFSQRRAAVRKGKRWEFIDSSGALVIPLQFRSVRPFRQNRAAVQFRDQWGYIDPTGDCCIPPAFDQAFDFREGIAVAGVKGKFGYIDPAGRWLTEPCFSFACGFRRGEATAEADGKVFRIVCDRKGLTMHPVTV
ncbi:MAG: WG repeat-containing protein [Rikenellaceae bacterium]|nr:WG repeat-containing protein [Rikenellaceae bacterium]